MGGFLGGLRCQPIGRSNRGRKAMGMWEAAELTFSDRWGQMW